MAYPQGTLPLLPLKNTVIFPGLTQVLRVGRDQSIKALKAAESKGFWIVSVQQKRLKENHDAHIKGEDIHGFGTLCRIDSIKGQPETGYQVVLKGIARVELENIHSNPESNYLQATSSVREDVVDPNKQVNEVLLKGLKELGLEILKLVPSNTDSLQEMITGIEDLSFLTSFCAGNMDLPLSEKQKLLEAVNLRERTLHLMRLMKEFKESLEIQTEIREKFTSKLGETQRQVLLREQLKTIQAELDETSDEGSDDGRLKKALEEAGLPSEAKEIAEQEMRRLKDLGPQSPESQVIRNYLQLLSQLPWSKAAPEKSVDLAEARRILEEDHYGLEKVKKRILQQLAVFQLRKNTKGSIILLVGPPGVGKTSLGESIAKSLGRKYARVSLGGVRDDADIRGHRRTYIGAMPGRIISALKRVGENNPVFILDEIDKLARGFSGDPASALLEVLDPEQNGAFTDHYVDIGFDLSKVVFICTANQLDTIPPALLDRMEVIEVNGYTVPEKVHIARRHLIPKQCEEIGVDPARFKLADDALLSVITHYTREAGVRELQRLIGTILRGSSEKFLENPEGEVVVRLIDLENLLGAEKFQNELAEAITPPGVVTGLAWSPVGGSILFVESTAVPGKGQLIMTGQLGDVMKESAQIAQSLVLSHLPALKIALDPQKFGLHVHVPAGAIPKDGPSAGVALFTSLMAQKPVMPKLGMTGEITLRGTVNPVGGIKEKVIAAHRAGLTDIILPEKNRKDAKEIPEEIRNDLRLHFVSRIEEVAKIAFGIDIPTLSPALLSEFSSAMATPGSIHDEEDGTVELSTVISTDAPAGTTPPPGTH